MSGTVFTPKTVPHVRFTSAVGTILGFQRVWSRESWEEAEGVIPRSPATGRAPCFPLDLGIQFITLRRRSRKLRNAIAAVPIAAWRHIELDRLARRYQTPRVLDQRIHRRDYRGPVRPLTITDLGHEALTLRLTNQRTRAPAKLIGRYAQRMLLENQSEDGIDVFHRDALSSAVALKISGDLQLTHMASSLYRLLATRIGHG
jgi:hypothetical protein